MDVPYHEQQAKRSLTPGLSSLPSSAFSFHEKTRTLKTIRPKGNIVWIRQTQDNSEKKQYTLCKDSVRGWSNVSERQVAI